MAPNMSDKGRSPISAERWICFSASVTKVCVLHPARIRTMDPTGYCLFLLTITLPIEFIFQLYYLIRRILLFYQVFDNFDYFVGISLIDLSTGQ